MPGPYAHSLQFLMIIYEVGILITLVLQRKQVQKLKNSSEVILLVS